MIVYSSRIWNAESRQALAGLLSNQPKSIIIFGLPDSGKSTLVLEIKKANPEWVLIDEWMTDNETNRIRTEKKLVVASQYLTVIRENTETEIRAHLVNQGLKTSEWVIVLIRRD